MNAQLGQTCKNIQLLNLLDRNLLCLMKLVCFLEQLVLFFYLFVTFLVCKEMRQTCLHNLLKFYWIIIIFRIIIDCLLICYMSYIHLFLNPSMNFSAHFLGRAAFFDYQIILGSRLFILIISNVRQVFETFCFLIDRQKQNYLQIYHNQFILLKFY